MRSFDNVFPETVTRHTITSRFNVGVRSGCLHHGIMIGCVTRILGRCFRSGTIRVLRNRVAPRVLDRSIGRVFATSRVAGTTSRRSLAIISGLLGFTSGSCGAGSCDKGTHGCLHGGVVDNIGALARSVVGRPGAVCVLRCSCYLTKRAVRLPSGDVVL